MAATDESPVSKADHFLALHVRGRPLLMPNAWDAGTAKLFESLGFDAVATTSSGFAATLGRLDGSVSLDEAIAHSATLVEATSVPVSADLENGYADDAAGVAATIERAVGAGLAGCSIEDFTGDRSDPIYDIDVATERVAAAADAAHRGSMRIVLTARCENFLHDRPDLDDTITRLQSYQEAGADVLYAPGLSSVDDIRSLVRSVARPVNVIARPGAPTVAELAEIGVARISVGGAFAWVAIGAAAEAAKELREQGTYGYLDRVAGGLKAGRAAFADGGG